LGDENSLAGTTKAHKHTSPASDGGFLETTETGITNMSEGSIGYYNSSSVLQELSLGSASDQIRVNAGATAPEYFTPSGGGATLTLGVVSYATIFSTSSTSLVSITNITHTCQAGSGHCLCLFNGICETDESFAFGWDYSVDANQPEVAGKASPVGVKPCNYTCVSATLSGQTIVLQCRVKSAAGTMSLQVDSTNSNFYALEIS